MNYVSLFEKAALQYRKRTALVSGSESITYSEFEDLSGRFACKLKKSGCRHGDFVLLLMDRSYWYMVAYMGILKAGCVVVPLVHDYPDQRIEFIRKNCSARLTVDESFVEDLEKYAPVDEHADGSEAALLVYTSGSSGTPKGILHSTADLARSAERMKILCAGLDEVNVGAVSLLSFAIHVFEYLTMFLLGACVHIVADDVRRDAGLLVDYIKKNNVTIAFVSPQLLKLFPECGRPLRRVITGSERVSKVYFGSFEVVNIYGMSECLLVSCFPVDRMYVNTPIGKALGDEELLVCDESGKAVPDGNDGEICIKGYFDTCYFKDAERTANTMVKCADGRTVLHSGDIGRRNDNGDLVYVNRRDWMVKINGQRVETQEVECLLMNIPEVDSAVVKAFVDEDGQNYLVAYYISESDIGSKMLSRKLSENLPGYMIPRFFVKKNRFEKNLNGKIDRNVLMPPSATDYKTGYRAPETAEEEALCLGFERVLHCGQVGVDDDFFALGGDSVKVLKLVNASGLDGLKPDLVLQGRTPAKIASLLESAGKMKKTAARLAPVSGAAYPLTLSQTGVYLDSVSEPASLKYNIPFACTLPEHTDLRRFAQAVKDIAGNHIAFGMKIRVIDGVPSMLYEKGDIEVVVKKVDDIASESMGFVKPFDLEKGPLCRFEIWSDSKRSVFLFDVHHIIFDGTSVKVFLSQIVAAYGVHPIADELISLQDVSAAEREIRSSRAYREAEEFFGKTLADVNYDSKPVSDVLVPNVKSGSDLISVDTRGRFNSKDVESFARRCRISENTLFMGAFAYALAKFSGTADSFFCTADDGRHDADMENSIGMFVKTLPVFSHFDDSEKVSSRLLAFQNDFYDVMRNDCISFGDLAAEYGVNTDVVFVYQSDLFDSIDFYGGAIKVSPIETYDYQSDINVMMMKEDGNYSILVRYKPSVYSCKLVTSLMNLYLNVIQGMLVCEKLSDITLTDPIQEATLDRLNATEAEYDRSETVVQLFRRQAKKTPDSVCLVFSGREYTYGQVDTITDNFACYLLKNGLKREKVAAIMVRRSEYMLLCALSVLKAGGAYLPLDPSYPDDRLNLMVRDSGAIMLVSTPELGGRITDFDGLRVMTECIMGLPPCDIISLPAPRPEDLFVMIYTSGSTGLPKGVMFEHSNVMVTVAWVKKYFSMDESTRVASYASFGFDANVFDMYPPITAGAQLHIIDEELRLDFFSLRDYFNENGITHAVMTTQIGRQFAMLGGFRTLKHMSVAGEKLAPFDMPQGISIYNLYGPTEGSVVTSGFKIDGPCNDIPIGGAVDNLKVYIVDNNRRLLPAGAIGELWISGPHVTRGYLNRPEKNEESYGENPFSSDPDYARVYRTGDIVRLMGDGNMQFIGRRDGQVKIRGFRVELTEIEEVIRRFAGIKDATVAAFDAKGGGKYIVAYVVSDSEVDTVSLCEFIRGEKPPYMVPEIVMQIDSIPLTQNQKVNKRALPVPERRVQNSVPPENEVQKRIFDIVAEVMGHGDFGIDTDMYEAGLTSIAAVKLNVELSKAFGISLKISDLKANGTIRQLETLFKTLPAAKKNYEKAADYPLRESQNGIFIECMANPDSTLYNIPVLIRLDDGIDIDRLCESVKAAINAHPYVKTTLFTDSKGDVRSRRNDGDEVHVPVIKCKSVPAAGVLVRPFNLIGGKLYRSAVYETPQANYLFIDFHHIISDGTSEGILFDDISRAYAGEKIQCESFSGYEAALEEVENKSAEAFVNASEYWRKLLSDCEMECLPKKEPEESPSACGSVTMHGSGGSAAVKNFCAGHSLSLNAWFNAVFAFVVSRFAGRDSMVHVTVFNGRNDSRLSRSVMLLARTVPVVSELNGDDSVVGYVKGIQEQLVSGMTYDAVSFPEMSSAYGVKADMFLVYQGDDMEFDSLCGKPAEAVSLPLDAAKAPLTFTVFLKGDHFEYAVDYRTECYGKQFCEGLLAAFDAAVLSFMKSNTIREVTMLGKLSDEIYVSLNDNEKNTPGIPVPEYIESLAKTHPDATAVQAVNGSLSFRELNSEANKIANALLRLGIKRDSIVGVVLDRTKEIHIAQIGIMKAGGAFLPMLPSYPDDRISFCLENAGSPFVITSRSTKAGRESLFAGSKPYRTLVVEELVASGDESNPGIGIKPEQLAYCIYTSGSTGTPKGVMIEHRNFSNFIETHQGIYEYFGNKEPCGSFLCVSSISFDMSVMELYLPVCCGKTAVIATDDELHNPGLLGKLMMERNVQMTVLTPSFINSVVDIPEMKTAFANLKTLVVGAEAFPPSLYDSLRKINPGLQIVNGYGPTECTICCSTKELRGSSGITIGRPTGNVKMFVLDKFGNILPPYCSGELIICGKAVGRGYVRLPDKTKSVFGELCGLPAYHSGDLVRINGNAEVDFSGRVDNQVKLRGFRVELDEIEKVMCLFCGVKQSKVLVRNNGSEDYLAGFFTADSHIDQDDLVSFMKSRLTYYMVPAVLMQLDRMPMTPNGKIDRKKLPETMMSKTRRSGRKTARKSLEQKLCEMFASVLKLDEVYADDNFFELGGTSLTASKITMLLMSDKIDVKYGDIFDNPTPELLSEFIESRNMTAAMQKQADDAKTRDALKYNTVKYACEAGRGSLGDVLLTGATGFLGIHVLFELLCMEKGHIYCLVRKKDFKSSEVHLKTMLVYYFSRDFADAFNDRISLIDTDITNDSLSEVLKDVKFDTCINCAACVKHFTDTDILDRVNVQGVEKLIEICCGKNARLVQISTVSVPGIHTVESYEKQVKMHENELFVIDDMDNKYGISKYQAELRILDAIEKRKLRAKIVRVGNLMGRHSDGEFQANMETNMFMRGIRGFAVMGKYPISHMTDPMRFSPIDCTAKAVVLLAGTNDKFTAFNADNRYGFDEMKIIDACNRNGIMIVPEEDEAYYSEFRKMLADDRVNEKLNGLAAYDIQGAHAVETDNLFTTNVLYRIGFSWPLADDAYLDRAIESLKTLGFFG